MLIHAFAGTVASQPEAYAYFLCALDVVLSPGQDVIITGERGSPQTEEMLTALNRSYAPNRVAIFKSKQNAPRLTQLAPYTEGLPLTEGKTAVHICSNGTCTLSADDPETMISQLSTDVSP